jgi:riboflavin biosynthesis pyrimidine reductase
VRNEERQRRRVARGLEAEPLSIVMSRGGDFPEDIPLFNDPAARIARFSGDEAAAPHLALERVRAEHGVRSVLCEGGPTLNGSLLATGLIDELFLTVAPVIAGTTPPLTIVEGAAGDPVALELVWTLEAGGMLFLRYRLVR